MALEAARHWFPDEPIKIESMSNGLLNQTFRIENSRGRFIAQKINPIFSPEVNLDIDAVTRYLQAKAFFTWRLIPTRAGELWLNLDGDHWRMLSFVQGDNCSTIQDSNMAHCAGHIVGQFHHALADFKHIYSFSRPSAHDTRLHMQNLIESLEKHKGHSFFNEAESLADKLLSEARILPDFSALPLRHGHGDLKISNLIFGSTVKQSTLIDFDTLGVMRWPIEMGDAFRSWCNTAGEDQELTFFDEKIFETALSAYAKSVGMLWTSEEISLLLEGICVVPLELSSRFLRDVLEESYFRFDEKRFSSRSLHNLVRAKGQYSLYCDIQKKKTQLEKIVIKAFT